MKKEHSFIIYGDSCSGIPNAPHADTLKQINSLIQKNIKKTDFIIFPGDEIIGLTNNEEKLRNQWDYWINEEMKYISEYKTPLFNCSGNHTVYNDISLRIFQEKLSNLPQNGPKGLKGISYYVEYPDLLMVFIDTMGNNIGGEGRVETEWLNDVLSASNSKYKLVIGHHPVFPTNGFNGEFQRTVAQENGGRFWNVLKENNVFSYICSHLLAYDVQVHDGILQIMTAGAGTQYRMPPETEYHHYLDCKLNENGLKYVVIDETGTTKDKFSWPIQLKENLWTPLELSSLKVRQFDEWNSSPSAEVLVIRTGFHLDQSAELRKTILCGIEQDDELPLIWIGITGAERKLTILLSRGIGRSPMHWYGPNMPVNKNTKLDIAFHRNMGPAGLLWKWTDSETWSSLKSSTPMEVNKVKWPSKWYIQHDGDNNSKGFKEDVTISTQILKNS